MDLDLEARVFFARVVAGLDFAVLVFGMKDF